MRSKLTPAFAAKVRTAPGASRTTYWDASIPASGSWSRRTVTEATWCSIAPAAGQGACTSNKGSPFGQPARKPRRSSAP